MLNTLHVLLHLNVWTVLVVVGSSPICVYVLENQGSERVQKLLSSGVKFETQI